MTGDPPPQRRGPGRANACPKVEVFVHPEHHLRDGIRSDWLEQVGNAAVPLAIRAATGQRPPLLDLEDVEVTLTDDRTIAAVHAEFLDDPSPTDVITFDHGEIVISTETAAAQGPDHGNSPERETALYLIHGLLHLAGHEDKDPADAAAMTRIQEEILNAVGDGDQIG